MHGTMSLKCFCVISVWETQWHRIFTRHARHEILELYIDGISCCPFEINFIDRYRICNVDDCFIITDRFWKELLPGTVEYAPGTVWEQSRQNSYPYFFIYRSLNTIAAQLKNCVSEISKRKCTYKYALILIFWKCYESNELNCILLFVVYSWHLYDLLVFNNTLLRF